MEGLTFHTFEILVFSIIRLEAQSSQFLNLQYSVC